MQRLGIRGFNPALKRAAKQLIPTTPDGESPPNLLAELHRYLARLTVVREQIAAIEGAPGSTRGSAELEDERHGRAAHAHHWRGHRNSRHAGSRAVVP
jgi:hypothetical protein